MFTSHLLLSSALKHFTFMKFNYYNTFNGKLKYIFTRAFTYLHGYSVAVVLLLYKDVL